MPKIKKTGIPEIDAFISQARKDAYKVLTEATKKLADRYEEAVTDFYASYTPKYYDRTYSTYKGTDAYHGYPKVYYSGDNTFTGGIIVDTNYIHGNPYATHMFKDMVSKNNFSKETIFSNTFLLGSHGGVKYSTAPFIMMEDAFEEAKAYVEKNFYNKYS